MIPTPPLPRTQTPVAIDTAYLAETLGALLAIHSPTGYTDPATRRVCCELEAMGIPYERTRRGALRATLPGRPGAPARAVVTHLDTIGAMVRELLPGGRLALKPIGTWSSRFAEGARVSVFTDDTIFRGTILPALASGHIFNTAVDTQPTGWDHVEVRIDETVHGKQDLIDRGIHVGDFVGVDAAPEFLANGFINARHLDDKAGVALVLAALKAVLHDGPLPCELHALFTISEEVGSGASAVLRGDVAEMLTVDNGTVGPGQESSELWPSVVLADSSGPFDYHLSRHLLALARESDILHGRDVFRYYRSDSASAVEAGNDIRTALVSFGVDSSHGYERTHMECLERAAQLVACYVRSEPVFEEAMRLSPGIEGFPETRTTLVEAGEIPPPPREGRNGD
jgi:peptidase M42 family hydrolase